jgi:hypothetical protein
MDNKGCTQIFTKAMFDDDDEEMMIYASLEDAKSPGSTEVEKLHGDYKLTVGEEYYVRYKLSFLDEGRTTIRFESTNTRTTSDDRAITKVEFSSQPLFRLD